MILFLHMLFFDFMKISQVILINIPTIFINVSVVINDRGYLHDKFLNFEPKLEDTYILNQLEKWKYARTAKFLE